MSDVVWAGEVVPTEPVNNKYQARKSDPDCAMGEREIAEQKKKWNEMSRKMLKAGCVIK